MIETAVDYKDLYEQSTVEIASLKQELNNLKRLIYGSKNERFIPANGSSSQLSLDMQFDTVAQCNVIKAQKIEYIRNATGVIKQRPSGCYRQKKLPVKVIIIHIHFRSGSIPVIIYRQAKYSRSRCLHLFSKDQ